MRPCGPKAVPRLSVVFAAFVVLSACTVPENEAVTELDTPRRIVAIGDLHGDLEAARAALTMAGAMGPEGHWSGGEMILVQTGDILDRGDGEEAILQLLRRLQAEAPEAGGEVHILNGNHELMNAYLDFRYVTEGGLADFEEASSFSQVDSVLASVKPEQRGRATAFRPGGPVALVLAEHPTALLVGNNLFVHGGILPEHAVMGMDAMNGAVREWLLGHTPRPEWVRGERSPVWTRLYSREPSVAACDTLARVLEELGADRMVVGHTVQRTGITSFCGGRVWCIDVGMAEHYGGRPEVLEIRGEAVRSIR